MDFMIYRKLGRTGLKVSQLGFGAMRLPTRGEGEKQKVDLELAVPMIHAAFDAGLNYIDTAVMYCNNDSQNAVGVALKGRRDKIVVSTKNPYYGEDEGEWWRILEESLSKLQIEYIDIYNHHGINWKSYTENVEPRISKWMIKAKDQGLIKHICTSFHDNNEGLVNLVKTGYPECITLQYNMLDRQLEEGIALAHESGIGVVVMGPVAGGRLGTTSDVIAEMVPGIKQVPELALRFVLANPNVTVALSGMSTMQHVTENIAIANDEVSLTEDQVSAIGAHLTRLKKLAELYCSGCGYCKPCPNDIDIPMIFSAYNTGRVYGLWNPAKRFYNSIGRTEWSKGKKAADACIKCGICLEKCPQKIDIPKQLAEAHEALRDS
jgi:hypothetical protein